jgi:S1-C subfamily serine protease
MPGSARVARRSTLIAFAFLACASAWAQVLSPALFLPIAASVVRIEVDREQGGLAVGSGVTVAPSVVATSCHVVRDAVGIRIAGSGAWWSVDGEHADLRRDVCFLRVPAWEGKPVVLAASSAPRSGAPVVALGFSGGAAISPRFGRIVALHAFDDGRVIESSAAFNSGSSGGGLFDAGGELLGLLTFRSRNALGSYYSVPVQWVRERIPDGVQWTHVQPLRGTLPFWQADSADELPYFMRAAALGAQRAWTGLLALCEQWSAASPYEIEPLLERARALHELHLPEAAAAVFADALQKSPDEAAAWNEARLAARD